MEVFDISSLLSLSVLKGSRQFAWLTLHSKLQLRSQLGSGGLTLSLWQTWFRGQVRIWSVFIIQSWSSPQIFWNFPPHFLVLWCHSVLWLFKIFCFSQSTWHRQGHLPWLKAVKNEKEDLPFSFLSFQRSAPPSPHLVFAWLFLLQCLRVVAFRIFWLEVILVKLWRSWIERHLPSVVVISCVLQSTMLPGINCTYNSCFLLCCNMAVWKKNAKDFGVKWRGTWIWLCHLLVI